MPTNRPDNPDSDYDLIIIGGGCSDFPGSGALPSGCSARACARTLIVEPRSRYTNDRSWCFWAQADHNNQARQESRGSQAVDMAVDLIAKSWPSGNSVQSP